MTGFWLLQFCLTFLQINVSSQRLILSENAVNNVSSHIWKDSFIDDLTNGNFLRTKRFLNPRTNVILNISRPLKKVSELSGDITIGGLMMVHEREDTLICGKIMPQGGIQALECMLYTIDWINNQTDFLPGITLGAYILDDCDKDTYGLEQAVDFIKGTVSHFNLVISK
ncbi:metabotropic glutamate receptor 8-like protein [Leptotrombidium deliense]|uniref:Metabotropic glutamate receptor 8-like protein n=1 Tax=Leptotrombidium deliense TaxID=299467 RepID=A0A443SF01_9ACAR|nr:metabotropic glutamate receptor 8-like protein [Leptotrombidium deliense]